MRKVERYRREREMIPTQWKVEDLSGDEYECMKMKRLSQYGDSAGIQVTEERRATPALGVWAGY